MLVAALVIFLGYLQENLAWDGDYVGVDIVPQLIEEAKKIYASQRHTFECIDILADPPEKKQPLAIALGVLNYRVVSRDHLSYVKKMIESMWCASSKVVVVDFISCTADIRRDHLFYADPAEIYKIASRFSKRVMIHHAYMPFEFQVKIWHEDTFDIHCPAFSPYL